MKLSQKAIKALLQARSIRLDLALALDFTEIWIDRLIKKNKDNGPLLTDASLEVIMKGTGLTKSEVIKDYVTAEEAEAQK